MKETMKIFNKKIILYSEEDFNYFEDIESELHYLDARINCRVLAVGWLGLWNGRKEGVKIFNNLYEAITRTTEDNNTLFYSRLNGSLKLEAIHHDGNNLFTFYAITEKGEKYINNNYITNVSQLLKNGRTKIINNLR